AEESEGAGLTAPEGGEAAEAPGRGGAASGPGDAPSEATEEPGQAAEPVVAEDQVQDGVVAAPTDEGPRRGRDGGDDGHPPAAADDQHAGRPEQLTGPAEPAARSEQEV